ncbi:unnamed protein product [Hapterophycus canaliculatus]
MLLARKEALDATRLTAGITITNAAPCHHCGAQLLAKESKGICCKNGKFVLPPLPPLPEGIERLYHSDDAAAVLFRRNSRKYNCKLNFASMNVEDGELKQMFGNHLLSVQGR